MGNPIVGAIPSFTTDESLSDTRVVTANEEGGQTPPIAPETTVEVPTEPVVEGTGTPAEPLPANEPPALDDELAKKVTGLQSERDKLLDEVKSLRGTRREIKQGQIATVDAQIDALKDINPEDITVIEKVLKAKGYMTQAEAKQMSYQSAQQQQLDQFLERYPEYKPENDPNDLNWSALQRELGFYRMPDDPRLIKEVLDRAHKNVAKPANAQAVSGQKQRVAVASHGAGGVQRPTTTPTESRLSPAMRNHLLSGGWSEEDIKNY